MVAVCPSCDEQWHMLWDCLVLLSMKQFRHRPSPGAEHLCHAKLLSLTGAPGSQRWLHRALGHSNPSFIQHM